MLTLRPRTLHSLLLTAVLVAALSVGAGAQVQVAAATPADVSATAGVLKSSDSDLRSLVEQLQMTVRDQQKRIDALEAERKTSSAGASVPAVVASAANPPVSSSAPAQEVGTNPQAVQAGSTDERIRNLERQIKGIGPVSFSGDIRLRAEPFFGGPNDESQDRARARVRLRFNALADLGSQFKAGLTLASGDINDPVSTNQTLGGFYARKAVALDQAFVQFTPERFKYLTVVGGKFRYPWYNTELTWDKDLNPEGVAETLGFNLDTPVLKKIALVGFQLPFAEVAGTAANDKRIAQQVTYGGQVQTSWQLGSHVTLGAFSGFYDWRGADAVAIALAKASSKNPQTPLTGLLPLNSSNTVQNSIYTTTASTVITIAGTAYPTGVTSVSNAQFASKFGLFDSLARLDIDTGHPKVPVAFIGDYVQNTKACSNLGNIQVVPTNTATTTFKQTLNFTCNPHQRRGYWAEGRVGRLKEKGDLQLAYTHLYIEREAVLSNFNYSDIRLGSNVTQHRAELFYQLDKKVQLGFTALVGRPLASTEPWLTRLQFDTVYIF